MENIKETIAKNLSELRKSHSMTQSALAEKLNYSDKAISRWEHAETLPDIETLCRICDIYGVSFEYLLTKDTKDVTPTKKRGNGARHVLMCLIAICTVWLAALTLFTSFGTLFGVYDWRIFIWAVPLSIAILPVCNRLWWHSIVFASIASSFILWTTILAIYLQLLEYNLWLLFVVGAPIQAIIILAQNMPKKRTK
jgi:transcriptional regulator with XRE-family HTH domain